MDASGRAVIFQLDQYATFGQRVLAAVVDVGVILVLLATLYLAYMAIYVPPDVKAMPTSPAKQKLVDKYIAPHKGRIFLVSAAAFVIYFLPITALPGGTLGYRISRIRLVDHRGLVPSWWQLGKRLLIVGIVGFICFGLCTLPLGLVVSRGGTVHPFIQAGISLGAVFVAVMLLYRSCSTHERRQGFHDRWSGTWMVRKAAAPMEGIASYKTVLLGTFLLSHLDLEPVAAASAADASPPPITSDAR
ncbi:MAG TPA: RDD family protein [Phycisphaerae bacterium]|nr:RDD family protein [Phycisphaerae bacterium]